MEDSVRRIIDLCELKGITRKDLCARIDLPPTTFSNWVIRGGRPKYEIMCKIANFFNVPVSYIMTGQEPHLNLEETVNELVTRISVLPEEKQDTVINLIFNVLSSVE